MATTRPTKENPKGPVDENNTGTELKALQSIEKAYYRNNPSAAKRNTKKSLNWFSTYVPKAYNRARTSQVMRDSSLYADKVLPGYMYFFVYDPKWKEELPFYDTFPLTFFFNSYKAKDGQTIYLGLNLHYLAPKMRMLLYTQLLKFKTDKRYRNSTRLKLQWQFLMKISESRFVKHCVHAYRADHFRSKLIKIPAQSWELSLFLPLQRFKKGGKSAAWKV